MNGFSFYGALAAILLHGAFFISAACVILWLCRRQSAARLSAGARLIIAVTLTLAAVESVRLFPSANPVRQAAITEPEVPAGTWLPLASLDAGPARKAAPLVDAGLIALPAATPDVPAGAAQDSQRHWEIPRDLAFALPAIWLAGAAWIVLRWALALILRQRWVRGAEDVLDDSWHVVLASVPCGSRIKRLLRHHGAAIPCAWGFFRPVMILPADAGEWTPAQRRMVLAHECAHIARHDPLWQAAGEIFLALQWFNPLAWILLRSLRMAGERAADDAVLGMEKDAPAYAELLVNCSRRWTSGRRIAAVTSFMARPSTVTRRVEAILDASIDRRPAGFLWPTAGAAACLTIAAIVMLMSPHLTVAGEAPPVSDSVPPQPDAPALPQSPDNTPAEAKFAPGLASPSSLEELHEALDTLIIPELKFNVTFLEQVVQNLHGKTKVHFIVRGGGDKTVTLDLRDATLRGAIEAICAASGMDYEIQQAPYVIIRPPQELQMFTRTYRVPVSFPGTLPNKDGSATAALQAAGIETPEGALASFDAPSRRLIVKNTATQHGRIYRFIYSGKVDGPFPWHPLKLGDGDYLSAAEMQIFCDITPVSSGGPVLAGADGTLIFGNKQFAMTWKKDDTAISMNNKRLILTHPVIGREDHAMGMDQTLWILRDDFSTLVEPRLRQLTGKP